MAEALRCAQCGALWLSAAAAAASAQAGGCLGCGGDLILEPAPASSENDD
jgi:hypothetical protein